MDWFVLGIAPTKDKKAITDAYRQKLRHTNPEEKPEEFKALRQAYETALSLADQADAPLIRDESPVGLWIEDVRKVYEDYPSRIDPALWEQLVRRDVCTGLDTHAAAEDALIEFLLDNFHLPKSVWQVLDQAFGLLQRVDELYESWPKEFIDNIVVCGIRLDSALDYDLFTPGKNGADCDAYRKLYLQANQMPLQNIGPILEQMDALSEKHPYGEIMRFCRYMLTGKKQEGMDGLRQLAQAYPDNLGVNLSWADVCQKNDDPETALQIVSRVLEIAPDNVNAKIIYARCLAQKEQYHEAKEQLYEVLHTSAQDPMLSDWAAGLIRSWNEKLIPIRQARCTEAPEDTENKIELAWCYAQNDQPEDALALMEQVDPASADTFSYHNLMGKLYHNSGNFAQALPHVHCAEEFLRNLTDDGTKETRKRIARLPEMLQIQGSCLMQLKRPEEAKEKFRQVLEIAPDNMEVLSMMSNSLFAAGDYPFAVEILRHQIQLSPNAWVAELLLATCLYRMHQDREAFDAINHALAIEQGDLSIYCAKLQILIRNQAYEEAYEILNFMKETGAPEHITVDFIKAELLHLDKKDTKTALKQYQALVKRVEAGENMIWLPELYFHLAVLTGNQCQGNWEPVLELIEKGLALYGQDRDLLNYKAWVLTKSGRPEDAIAMYRQLLQENPQSVTALRGLADLYYEDLSRYAKEALACYEALLKNQRTAELFFFAATCKRLLGDWDGAAHYYRQELEMDPGDIDAFRGLAFICDARGDYANSLTYLDQALAVMAESGQSFDWLIEHKSNVLRRLGQFREALAFAVEAENRYSYADSLQLQFDICCQAGMWEQAAQVLEQWKKKDRNAPGLLTARNKLSLLQGKTFQAVMAMGLAKHKLPQHQVQEFRLQLAALECNHQRQIEIWSRKVSQDPSDDHAMTNLAYAYHLAGRLDAAQGAAMKALALQDDLMQQSLSCEALYRSRRCLVLAILGRAEEAKAELQKVRQLPLCDFCEYSSCKDADVFEAAIAEILGDLETAKKLCAEGKRRWPDELDFIAGELRLNKKGRN